MTTVEILPLSGLSAAEAMQAVEALLDLDTGRDSLERLLVLDETAMLHEHADVYQHIDAAKRVEKPLCVTVGSRPGDGRKLDLPGNLGGVQGWPVVWVSRPAGINWRVAKAAVANRHPGNVPAALDQHPLVRLLAVEEMFDRVQRKFLEEVPGRIASPGLWLAGADDEAATFAGALAVAIRRICEPGSGTGGPFGELLPDRTGGASLSESGPLARYLGRAMEMDRAASHALGKRSGLGGMVNRGSNGVRGYVSKLAEALTDFRDLIMQVLRDASASGELTVNQRDLIGNAGLEFEARPGYASATGAAVEQSLIYQTLDRAVKGGDSIPLLAKRLIETERQVTRHGSASYLPEVDKRCPTTLLARLADSPEKAPRFRTVADARNELGLDDAAAAAQALVDLILFVANREWSPASVTARELAGARAALDGTRKALTEHASAAGGPRGGARGARLSRLGANLLPALCDLVLHVVMAELASPCASGQEALRAAHDKAATMLGEWTRHVQAEGVAAKPPFASYTTHEALHVTEDDIAGVRDALLYPATDEMWQLCTPADLGALDVDRPPISIRFAPRLNMEALIGTVPRDEPVWTSSGSYAGVLRLVPLRAGVASSNWSNADAVGLPTVTER